VGRKPSMSRIEPSRFDFPLKNVVFILVLATLMIPFQAILVPLFLVLNAAGMTIWPPVDFRLDATPRVLVTSPRERIERREDLLIDPYVTVPDMDAMEERLLEIIKTGKGEIKDLLEAETVATVGDCWARIADDPAAEAGGQPEYDHAEAVYRYRKAIKKGDIDAIVNLDPVISKLTQDGDVVVMADLRTDEVAARTVLNLTGAVAKLGLVGIMLWGGARGRWRPARARRPGPVPGGFGPIRRTTATLAAPVGAPRARRLPRDDRARTGWL
jgi:hypothetical protein